MSWNLLERFIESEHFNKDPSLTVAYLARYANHVGIIYVLCAKLRNFSYNEIEFFLPQLCHLLVSSDNDSTALEEFIVDLCQESVNGAILTFWLFQTYLRDLATDPTSTSFATCRRIYNKVQRIIFSSAEPPKREKIKENVLPVSVLSSIVLGSVAVPRLASFAGPLAVAQARKARPVDGPVPENAPVTAPSQLQRSRTVAEHASVARHKRTRPHRSKRLVSHEMPSVQTSTEASETSSPIGPHKGQLLLDTKHLSGRVSTTSLPETSPDSSSPSTPYSGVPSPLQRQPSELMQRRHSLTNKTVSTNSLSTAQKRRMLRSHYFHNEIQFLAALEDISSRLVIVPKAARLSALRAELALIAQDLPAEVDIPLICPATLDDGQASKSRHHRIVRLNPAEATSLNSAERVPYLLMLEILRDDLDFDPDSSRNNQLLTQILSERGRQQRRLFDITHHSRTSIDARTDTSEHDDGLDPAEGDLASPALLQELSGDGYMTAKVPSRVRTPVNGPASALSQGSFHGGLSSRSSMSLALEMNANQSISQSSSPGTRKISPLTGKPQLADQSDVATLAVHMRAASHMLAQLELSSSKRPRAEVEAIKAKIIASMQTLEEQSFVPEDGRKLSTFEAMLVSGDDTEYTSDSLARATQALEGSDADLGPNTGVGLARMENDFKTGGVQRSGDRDDPSAATFGEAWEAKRARIRRSSPYGWMKNWDLVSVIVKTGADQRQEAFACQLIAVCGKIWSEANVPVWVKQMRILVTGESSGLIETITNGVSLHSLKRSLTLASLAANEPRKRIATLKDHFLKTFGESDTQTHMDATENFAKSLAAYSMISYVLQLKDRHNGNILIDDRGHIIHIDFGFMLSNSPGSMGFEAAPFKMTAEYVDVLGGLEGTAFKRFKDLAKEAFQALRRDAERIVMLVELMGRDSKMPCYGSGLTSVVAALRGRFVLERGKEEASTFVEELIAKSVGSYYTRLYDAFQYRSQGIY